MDSLCLCVVVGCIFVCVCVLKNLQFVTNIFDNYCKTTIQQPITMNMDDNLDVKPSFDQATASNNADQQASISSFYPLPPMRYIKQFTDINVRNRCTPLPPKPFVPGSYLMFGQNITIDDTIIRSLESQGLRRLYPREYDHKRELKKINASILVNFLDLIDVLIRCPDTHKREEKCNDLQLLFITVRFYK